MKLLNKKSTRKVAGKITGLALCMATVLTLAFLSTVAQACGPCTCVTQNHDLRREQIVNQHQNVLQPHITDEFTKYQKWIVDEFFHRYVVPTMMHMTEQLTVVGMHQVFIVGVLLDAKIELETQRLYQEKTAEAHKSYHPAYEVCEIGSGVRNLAVAEQHGDLVAFTLGQRSMERQIAISGSSAHYGPVADNKSRLKQFKERYCNVDDNAGKMEPICGTTGGSDKRFINRDIDYTSLVEVPKTLDINFTDTSLTHDEQDVLALTSNLFAHDLTKRLQHDNMWDKSSEDDYTDLHSIIAKRSVAENSFSTIIGLKSKGTGAARETGKYLPVMLKHLGVDLADAKKIYGEEPSYFAQMEVIAQRIYQSPEFYATLYDTPTNVNRKEVILQALNLMVDRDVYKSEIRSEALLALLLEMETAKLRDEVQSRIESLTQTDEEG